MGSYRRAKSRSACRRTLPRNATFDAEHCVRTLSKLSGSQHLPSMLVQIATRPDASVKHFMTDYSSRLSGILKCTKKPIVCLAQSRGA